MFDFLQIFRVIDLVLMKSFERPDGREIGEDLALGGGEFRRLAEVIAVARPPVAS